MSSTATSTATTQRTGSIRAKTATPDYGVERGPYKKRPALSGVQWQKTVLFFVFGALLLVVALTSATSSSPLVPALLVGAVGIAVLAILRPSVALWLIFVGAGLPSLVVPLSFHTVRLIELALLLCVLIIFLRRPAMQLRLPHLLALLFFGVALASFVNVPQISTRLNAYAADKELFSLLLLLLALFCGTFLVQYVKNMSTFLVAILLGNIPLCLIVLAQALGIHLSTLFESSSAQDLTQTGGRFYGPFDGAATFGSYLVNLFAVALVCWLFGTRRRDQLIGFGMTAVTALLLVGSGTRSTAVAAIVITLIAFILTRRYKLLLTTLLLSGFGIVFFFDKLVAKFAHSDVSASNRLFLWQEALKLIGQHPLLGIGLEQFPRYYTELLISQATLLNPNGISVHNQYLEYAMESGIIWLVVALALLVSVLFVCMKAYRHAQRQEQTILVVATLAILGNMLVCFVDVPLDKPEATVFLFILVGLALGYAERIRQRTNGAVFGVPNGSVGLMRGGVQASSATGSVALYTPKRTIQQIRPARVLEISEDTGETPSVRKTGRSVIFQLLSWGISVIVIFPPTALLTRYLGPIHYGEYSYTFPFLATIALLSGTGMDPLIVRKLSKQKRTEWGETLSYAAGTRLMSTLLASAVACITAFLLPINVEQRNLLLVGSLTLLFSFSFNGLRIIYACGYWAEQRAKVPSSLEAINRITTAGLIALVVLLRLPLLWVYSVIVGSDLPFFLLLVFFARRRYQLKIRFSLAAVREYFVGGLPLTGHNALTQFASQANVILLLPLAGSLSVGIYALAQRVTTPLFTIAVAFVIGIYPLLCTTFEAGREKFADLFNNSMRLVALCIIPLAIFVSAEAKNIVTLLGGAKFAAAVPATQLLMWAMVATFLNELTVRCCMAANKERSIPLVTGIALALNVGENLLFIPLWQATGAGAATLLSEVIALCMFALLLRRDVRLLQTVGILLRVGLGCVPALLLVLWFPDASLLVLAPTFALLVGAGFIVTRVLSLNDIVIVRQILTARKSKQSRPSEHTTLANLEALDITEQPTLIVPRIRM